MTPVIVGRSDLAVVPLTGARAAERAGRDRQVARGLAERDHAPRGASRPVLARKPGHRTYFGDAQTRKNVSEAGTFTGAFGRRQ